MESVESKKQFYGKNRNFGERKMKNASPVDRQMFNYGMLIKKSFGGVWEIVTVTVLVSISNLAACGLGLEANLRKNSFLTQIRQDKGVLDW